MKLAIRDAHLENDRAEIIRFLFDNLTKTSDAARFDWLYLQSPFGIARAWIAYDSESGDTIGLAAAFPRNFLVRGVEQRAWVLGDFCISSTCRSLGPALQLQRACIDALGDDPWYDFPSRSMMAIYKRMGLAPFGSVARYAKLLRVDRKIEDLVPLKSVARAVGAAGNTLLRNRARTQAPAGVRASVFDQEFGPAFDTFGTGTSRDCETQGQRTSSFLNWRYRRHPVSRFSVLVANHGSELSGYAVAEVTQRDAVLADVQVRDESTLQYLLEHLSEILSDKLVETFSAPVMATPAVDKCLQAAGFRIRETSPVVAHGMIPSACLLLAGDRD